MTLLLEGDVVDERDTKIAKLEREVDRLQSELRLARVDAQEATQQATRSVSALRKQLSPLYQALQMVFGEIEAVAGEEPAAEASGTTHGDGRVRAVWESWKQKLGAGSGQARVIDALLEHGELNVAQLKVAAKMATQTVYDSTSKLNGLGLLTKNGGRYSLKKLP